MSPCLPGAAQRTECGSLSLAVSAAVAGVTGGFAQHAGPNGLPLIGEALWQHVKTGLVQDFQSANALIVFDWDDTLLPTAALASAGFFATGAVVPAMNSALARCAAAGDSCQAFAATAAAPGPADLEQVQTAMVSVAPTCFPEEVPGLAFAGLHTKASASATETSSPMGDGASIPPSTEELGACAEAAIQAVRAAVRHGRVVILTNAVHGWVQDTALRFLPELMSDLATLPVISARSIFEPLGVVEPWRWKALCMQRILSCFKLDKDGVDGMRSLVSIGDSWHERAAAILAVQDLSFPCYVKCLKLSELPTIRHVAYQLNLCAHYFEWLVSHDGHLDLKILPDGNLVPVESFASPGPTDGPAALMQDAGDLGDCCGAERAPCPSPDRTPRGGVPLARRRYYFSQKQRRHPKVEARHPRGAGRKVQSGLLRRRHADGRGPHLEADPSSLDFLKPGCARILAGRHHLSDHSVLAYGCHG